MMQASRGGESSPVITRFASPLTTRSGRPISIGENTTTVLLSNLKSASTAVSTAKESVKKTVEEPVMLEQKSSKDLW